MLNLILGLSAFSLNPTVTAPPLPCTWHELRAAKAKYPVKIAFSLVEQNMEKLKSIALQVSTPGSAMYGQHLSQTAIDAIVAPSNASLKHVVEWLSQATGPTAMITQRREVITLETTAADAAQALHATSGFVHFHNTKTEQRALRLVGDIRLPRDVAPLIQSIYGIHGLPLPPRRSIATAPVRKIGDAPVQVAITPKEIRAAYQVDAAAIGSGSPQNAQAVAEFQGQTMSSEDLVAFFKEFVPNAKGKNVDVVSKFVGDKNEDTGEVEASLDIQYIMGVAPGVKTQFWYYSSNDFCLGLKTWTSDILDCKSGCPLVHSVSYGVQANLTTSASGLGCKPGDVEDIDNAFAKIAAKGISILFASGDSGAGYKAVAFECQGPAASPSLKDTSIIGAPERTVNVTSASSCCGDGVEMGAFSYTEPPPPAGGGSWANCSDPNTASLKNVKLTGETVKDSVPWPHAMTPGPRAVEECCQTAQEFHGEPGSDTSVGWTLTQPSGAYCSSATDVGEIKDHVLEGEILVTFHLRAEIPGQAPPGISAATYYAQECCTEASEWPRPPYPLPPTPALNDGWSYDHESRNCTIFYKVTGESKVLSKGSVSHRGPQTIAKANCTVFKTVQKQEAHKNSASFLGGAKPAGVCNIYKASARPPTKATPGTVSGGPAFLSGPSAHLYPSWPAISPWVTSVGSTRFVDATKTSGAEMATDQFGSGGGFSWDTKAFTAQHAAVKHYLTTYADLMPPTKVWAGESGRATPDVSGLGEGYQVIVGGHVNSVGGTSASTPMFAGLVSLINEELVKSGKPALGFLNPFLYANADAFHDVTVGDNFRGRGDFVEPLGFNCTAGWDAASGLGTPNFKKLLAAATKAAQAQ